MANEENLNVTECETNEAIMDYEDTQFNVKTFDWNKIWDFTQKAINYLTIGSAYFGILAIFSFPVLHIINYFCHIDSFMKTLPLGYMSWFSNSTQNDTSVAYICIIIFGAICVFVALKLGEWLVQKHSIVSRIACILLGSGFIYIMIDKQANEIVYCCTIYIFGLLGLIFFAIPALIIGHNCFCPIFKGLVPSVFTYYKFLFSFFPKTSGLMKFCDNAKNSVEATNAHYAEENRRQKEEQERRNTEFALQNAERERQREKEKQERETITSAKQQGNVVRVYGLKGTLFTKIGTLRGYTNSTVSIEYNGHVSTYNGRGNAIY